MTPEKNSGFAAGQRYLDVAEQSTRSACASNDVIFRISCQHSHMLLQFTNALVFIRRPVDCILRGALAGRPQFAVRRTPRTAHPAPWPHCTARGFLKVSLGAKLSEYLHTKAHVSHKFDIRVQPLRPYLNMVAVAEPYSSTKSPLTLSIHGHTLGRESSTTPPRQKIFCFVFFLFKKTHEHELYYELFPPSFVYGHRK